MHILLNHLHESSCIENGTFFNTLFWYSSNYMNIFLGDSLAIKHLLLPVAKQPISTHLWPTIWWIKFTDDSPNPPPIATSSPQRVAAVESVWGRVGRYLHVDVCGTECSVVVVILVDNAVVFPEETTSIHWYHFLLHAIDHHILRLKGKGEVLSYWLLCTTFCFSLGVFRL